MRKLSVFLVLMVPAWLTLTTTPAQETSGGIIFSRYRQFRIPFNPGTGAGRLKQLQLFVSTDQGRSWQPSATAPPEQGHFRFISERDGYFWFTVQTLDLEGRLYPLTLDGASPSLKVVIDTLPPTVVLQALTPRNGEVGVSWDIRDENLDLSAQDAARLEYRVAGNPAWFPVTMPAGARQTYWTPQGNGAIEVRLRVRDRAGNVGEAGTTLNPGGGGFANNNNQGAALQPNQGIVPFQNNDQPQPIFNGPTEGERKLVGSKRINLNYELKEVGPSGVSQVELWYTQDGRSWNKYPLRFGDDPNQKNIVFDVAGEGIYGISLVAKSGVGLGDRPPQIGDRPQLWVEVDITKPVVQLHNVLVGTGPDKGKLNVTWSARDKNLGREPITLSYAEQLAGPWTPIAEKAANTGRHIWTMPERVPYQFHLKVEAVDLAGNIGEAVTDSLIKVDLSQPKVKILNVEPAGK
jgi:hypothetical protein